MEEKKEEELKIEDSKDDININQSIEKEKMEFFDTKDLLRDNNEKKGNSNKIIITDKFKDDEKEIKGNENININKESMSEINISNNIESSHKKQNNKMKLNIFKNMPKKDLKEQMIYNTGGEDQKLKLDIHKDFTHKLKNNGNNMNINFNDINIPNFNEKYINNFLENNEPNFKSGNNYQIFLKNKGNKKSRTSNKINNNIIPFIEYNQNNNIITNFMLNHNNNQKLFVKFNKDIQRGRGESNNIININTYFHQVVDNNLYL